MQWEKVPDNVNNDDFNVQWWKDDRVWQSCLCLCGVQSTSWKQILFTISILSQIITSEKGSVHLSKEPPVYLFSLSPHYGTVKPCHPYQLFCSKSWPWPRNRPKVIKRSINSPFTFDRHSRFLVVAREQTWESVWQKIEDWDIPFAGGAKVSKKEQIAQWGRTDGAEVWHSFKVFGTLQVASLTRQGWGTARWWNLFKNL